MEWLWWWGAALLLVMAEILSLDLVLLMFAGGAIAAGIAAALGVPFAAQILLLALVSVLLLLVLRPWLLRYLRERVPLVETNTAAQVGRLALVVEDVDIRGGRVKLSGEVWSARAAQRDVRHEAGSEVRVVAIDGATAVVDDASVLVPGPVHPDTGHPRTGRVLRRFGRSSATRSHRPEETA